MHQITRVELAAHVRPVSRGLLHVEVVVSPDFQFEAKVHDYAQIFHVIVEDVDGERILHHEPLRVSLDRADAELDACATELRQARHVQRAWASGVVVGDAAQRAEGEATVHRSALLHAVTRMQAGGSPRYSLVVFVHSAG